MEQNFEINGKLVIELVNYLGSKPFAEVYQFIQQLQQLQQLKKVEVKESK